MSRNLASLVVLSLAIVAVVAWWSSDSTSTPRDEASRDKLAAHATEHDATELTRPPNAARSDATVEATPPPAAPPATVETTGTAPATLIVALDAPGPPFGDPLEVVVSIARPSTSGPTPARRWSKTFDAANVARFEGLPPDETLRAELELGLGIVPERVEIAPLHAGEARRETWTIRRTILHVDAREESGAPCAGLELSLARGSDAPDLDYFRPLDGHQPVGITDARGRRTLADLPPGEYRVGPAIPGTDGAPLADFAPCPLAQRIVVEAGKENVVELVVHRGRRTEGRVLRPDGTPYASGTVLAKGANEAIVLADVDAEGRFRFPSLRAGRYELTLYDAGDVPFGVPHSEVEAGATDIVLQLTESARIRGYVVGRESNAELPWISISAEGMPMGYSVRCRADGSFGFDGLGAAVYTLRADAGAKLAARSKVVLRVGQKLEGVELRLETPATLVIRHASPASVRVRIIHGDEVVDVLAAEPGEPTRRRVLPGTVMIEQLDATGGVVARRALTVAADETRDVALEAGR